MGEKGFLESGSPTFRIDSSGKDTRRTGFEGPDWRQKAKTRSACGTAHQKAKTIFKLFIFMVEFKKSTDSPDIFTLKKCCYLVVKVDTFNRRPGVKQCYNCNLFSHLSKNCRMCTRCLNTFSRTGLGTAPSKKKVESPTCINFNEKGHLANSNKCNKFPKIKQEELAASQYRNIDKNNSNTKVHNTFRKDFSYVSTLTGTQQDKKSNESSSAEATSAHLKDTSQSNNNE
ncbi:hypothetical protein TNCV_1175081 [Trichonephila clavipes]|nr:hypothetical protein TNCV_1175081 [Trichonephila clavipes]